MVISSWNIIIIIKSVINDPHDLNNNWERGVEIFFWSLSSLQNCCRSAAAATHLLNGLELELKHFPTLSIIPASAPALRSNVGGEVSWKIPIEDNNGDKNKYLFAVRLRVEICWKYDLLTTLSWCGWTRPGRPCRPVTDTKWAVYRVWRVSLITELESCFYITPRLRLQSLWKSYYFILCSWGQYPTHLLWTLNLETFLCRIIQGFFWLRIRTLANPASLSQYYDVENLTRNEDFERTQLEALQPCFVESFSMFLM